MAHNTRGAVARCLRLLVPPIRDGAFSTLAIIQFVSNKLLESDYAGSGMFVPVNVHAHKHTYSHTQARSDEHTSCHVHFTTVKNISQPTCSWQTDGRARRRHSQRGAHRQRTRGALTMQKK